MSVFDQVKGIFASNEKGQEKPSAAEGVSQSVGNITSGETPAVEKEQQQDIER